MENLENRRVLLCAALGFTRLEWSPGCPCVVETLLAWLDSWPGLGAIVAGMTAQAFNLELRQFPHGWRASFYPVGLAHSVVIGSAWEPRASRAVHAAAWEALAHPRSTAGRV